MDRAVDDTGRFAFEDLPNRETYWLFAPNRLTTGFDEYTTRSRDSVIDPATGSSAPFAIRDSQEVALGVGYRAPRLDFVLASTGTGEADRTAAVEPVADTRQATARTGGPAAVENLADTGTSPVVPLVPLVPLVLATVLVAAGAALVVVVRRRVTRRWPNRRTGGKLLARQGFPARFGVPGPVVRHE